ncbi:MAG: hypothetical protein AAGB15_04110, partial [Pseudomonadota bacterium]
MQDHTHLFDATTIDTPAGMTPTVAASGITHVPSQGTGLSGEVFITNGAINTLTQLEQIVATRPPVMTFTATQIDYSGRQSDTTISEFLGADAASIQGAPGDAFEMGPSGFKMTGFIYIPPGTHEIEVTSDDGFSMKIGGVDFSDFEGR